jgi:hypothetical protein
MATEKGVEGVWPESAERCGRAKPAQAAFGENARSSRALMRT